MQLIGDGSVTTPAGFVAAATYAGLKTYADHKRDLGMLVSTAPCAVAGVFTTNRIKSPSVVLTERLVREREVRAVVVASGIANACVGEQGMVDAQEMVQIAARHASLEERQVCVCTTGLIGAELPMALVRAGIPALQLSDQGGIEFARATMTTDRLPKSAAVRLLLDDREVTIGGCVKGAGMVHPDMATMLAFLTTDAALEHNYLQAVLQDVIDNTFNMATIDGDGSTNDSVLLFANGLVRNPPLTADSPGARQFRDALLALCDYLCREMVRDAEGANKIFSVEVAGAGSDEDARQIARTIASSTLVKCAVHGNDPNWGRIVAAAGRAGAQIDESRLALEINGVAIMERGQPIPFHKESIIVLMRRPDVTFTLRLGLGKGSGKAWGCEMTEEYVTFNSAYTT